MIKEHFKLISGTANRKLAEEVSKLLKVPLTPVEIKRFHDDEIYCRVLESVRGCDVYLIQPTSPDANLNLMELLIMIDALKRSSPDKITAVIPYYGYCRQDKKSKPREPITAKLIAKTIKKGSNTLYKPASFQVTISSSRLTILFPLLSLFPFAKTYNIIYYKYYHS